VFFLRRIAAEFGRDVDGFDTDALAALRGHPWRGNVREMIAAIRRAVVMGNTPRVQAADLALEPVVQPEAPTQPQIVVRASFARPRPGSDAERNTMVEALEENSRNITRTARSLGVSRITLYRMLRRHGLMTQRVEFGERLNGGKSDHVGLEEGDREQLTG
jgi:DNA-binding NtrC family response regulator